MTEVIDEEVVATDTISGKKSKPLNNSSNYEKHEIEIDIGETN